MFTKIMILSELIESSAQRKYQRSKFQKWLKYFEVFIYSAHSNNVYNFQLWWKTFERDVARKKKGMKTTK